jgi:hypothetical protein
MTNISCKVQENFLGRYFVKNFLAAVLLALPDIFQHCLWHVWHVRTLLDQAIPGPNYEVVRDTSRKYQKQAKNKD